MPQPNNSPATLTSPAIWTASEAQLCAALSMKPMKAQAIAVRLSMFRALGYFVAPMTEEQSKMRLIKFRDALKPYPEIFSSLSFDGWFETMKRAPTPGDIANGASSLVSRARDRLALIRRTNRPPTPRDPEPTPEELDRRRRFCAQMAREFPELIGRSSGDA